ncbi:YgjV family protein [uncultured Clostridium sp.]|uniref:YgjV family protein n=1 Tax=uncultured Clostridium sp. TaxID=59620 RepID=UPI0025F7F146|nr:YgjV family protein [uncultured Clostridium sp.]
MFNVPWIEYVGYAASILIGISMFMKNIVKLRFINLLGSLLFTFYGFTIKAYPVAIVNVIIVFTNIYYIYKMTNE